MVVVEEVYWADEATLDMLRFVGRRIKSAGVLLIATYRDEDLAAGDPLRVVLGELARQRSARRVELGPAVRRRLPASHEAMILRAMIALMACRPSCSRP